MSTKLPNVIFPYIIGTFGGFLFYLAHLPLAWILGPMTFLIIWRSLFKKISTFIQPNFLKNGSFIILGISFGLSFTKETFVLVGPYVIPFLLTTVLLIFLSVCNGLIISKLVNIDRNTSIFASIPGGLTEMVAASEAVHANPSLVTIFQTVRLLTVVFLVPFTILHMFEPPSYSQTTTLLAQSDISIFSYSWYFLAGFVGWGLRKFLPASYVIGPLLTTASLKIIGIELPLFHDLFMIFAQISIGVGFGLMITFNDLKKGGKYCGLYFITTMILIVASFGFGYVFSLLTDLNLATAMLSLAPGGLVEMVLTASSIGADPAVVSSLQFIRLLFIISVVPSLLKFSMNKLPSKSLN
ncbi:AbrB family transcriptional regulator [Metabacillus endolithicus]|uniref:AbrB family transcriptional regulator n=1 Tax=Metabacillus endolithicus TaxID=1535204 RepID=A0ABW5BSE0_9BACI|nr:AbrB family transcriptional regulator [Metabacillus endolithicus]UPG63114.1 AbrB family transcriptional regulator [Metabacillus endolithicus]